MPHERKLPPPMSRRHALLAYYLRDASTGAKRPLEILKEEEQQAFQEDSYYKSLRKYIEDLRATQLGDIHLKEYRVGWRLYRNLLRRGYERAGLALPFHQSGDLSSFLKGTIPILSEGEEAEKILSELDARFDTAYILAPSNPIDVASAEISLGTSRLHLAHLPGGREEIERRIEIFPQQEPYLTRFLGDDIDRTLGCSDELYLHQVILDRTPA